MSQSSMKMNAILNGLRTVLAVLFPLITYPYACKVLGVVNTGKVSFGDSVVSYFMLIAALGISSYAIREGSARRDHKESFRTFISEMFSINLCSTVIAYILLVILLLMPTKINQYTTLILIQSVIIISTTIGMEWYFSIKENYIWITVRYIVVQLLSIAALFLFVRKQEDYYNYALIIVVAATGANLFNFVHILRQEHFYFTFHFNLRQHIKPIMVLFATGIMLTIYVNSDVTILGLLCDDHEVGLYSTSVKIYKSIKQVINAIVVVSIPRLSYYINNKDYDGFIKLLQKELEALLILLLPCIVGLELTAKEMILIVAKKEFIDAVPSLQILGIALLFAVLSAFVVNSILLPSKNERISLIASVWSALINIVLNIILIPVFRSNAAAFTTVLAEMVVLLISSKGAMKHLAHLQAWKVVFQSLTACVGMSVVVLLVKSMIPNIYVSFVVSVLCGMITYGLLLIVLRNTFILEVLKGMKQKFNKG